MSKWSAMGAAMLFLGGLGAVAASLRLGKQADRAIQQTAQAAQDMSTVRRVVSAIASTVVTTDPATGKRAIVFTTSARGKFLPNAFKEF